MRKLLEWELAGKTDVITENWPHCHWKIKYLYEILKSVIMSAIFCDVPLRSLVGFYRHSSKTSVKFYQTTWRHFPEDSMLFKISISKILQIVAPTFQSDEYEYSYSYCHANNLTFLEWEFVMFWAIAHVSFFFKIKVMCSVYKNSVPCHTLKKIF
jgi:hypothetical protein